MNKRFMRFRRERKKSVTLSYDDCMEEDADLIELLEKYQMKATFNLIPDGLQKRERLIRRKPIVWLRKRKPKKCMNIRL